MYRVLLVDDQSLFREIARSMLDEAGGFEISGEATDGAQAVEISEVMPPDLVLMDVQMPRMNGIDAARRIVSSCPGTAVVLMSMERNAGYGPMALAAGAAAFMSKRDLDPAALRAILDGRAGLQSRAAA
jgi:DNA-binding NarL/FixJ family response regulator